MSLAPEEVPASQKKARRVTRVGLVRVSPEGAQDTSGTQAHPPVGNGVCCIDLELNASIWSENTTLPGQRLSRPNPERRKSPTRGLRRRAAPSYTDLYAL